MTTLRLPYYELSTGAYNGFLQANKALAEGPVDQQIIELVYLRVSQINGCAFCLEMHSTALRKSGAAQQKLDALAGWRISRHFSPAERAALAWAEDLTNISATHAPESSWQEMEQHFSAREISDITFAISLMNAFNRLAISMRM
ncbi:carboxymuconolactone decarboxylase family protein [Shimwellia pseudoproteus]|uniref:carboxymuconolactone decarboxylase family protein n=1 Tax=Shimwellia pseudoproteus TaxID=570012 RepID=UPI0018ECB66B|nr:carboxymuconolactone decarboxylase family protein [Shimwellia pseudoproteus]MBJ3816062.1 carboxymuconolactone decarboxylase family protein [Shimwellia pseudoproteus]